MGRKVLLTILIALPLVSQMFVLPLVNKIDPILFGLPFLQFWLFLWIILTPLCTLGIYKIQKSQGGLEE